MDIKICKICEEENLLDNYCTIKDGQSICEKCSYSLLKEYIKNNSINLKREQIECDCGKSVFISYLTKHKETDIHRRRMNNIKKCTTCKLEKPYEYFHNCMSTHDKRYHSCKECEKLKKKLKKK